MSVRVRFAPSPTGHVHIGNIRAAIFNWLFARHEGGRFLLRIEDTDTERSTDEAKRTLLEAMEWLGLNYDEPIVYQSQQVARHLEAAARLEREGNAYRGVSEGGGAPPLVFRIPGSGASLPCLRLAGPVSITCCAHLPVTVSHAGVHFTQLNRKGAEAPFAGCLAGFQDLRLFAADGRCLFELEASREELLRSGVARVFEGVARLAYTRREVFFDDVVKGTLSKPLEDMKDLVIVRSSGAPVFHLANVCDDISQQITHIIRGDDHVENTYRHVLLFLALGVTPPRYGHLPMIVNQQGKPYSKRDGDAYVGDFRSKGFLAEALFNYLSLLGWSPGEDREKMTRAEAVSLFTLDRVKNGPAQMDLKKLTHLNWQYINAVPPEEFVRRVRESSREFPWAAAAEDGLFRRVCALMQSRTNTWSDAAAWSYFFTDGVECDEKEAAKLLRREGVAAALEALERRLADADFSEAGLEPVIRQVERASGIPEGKLNQPIRLAVTGSTRGAGLYETMVLVGRERCLARLRRARELYGA